MTAIKAIFDGHNFIPQESVSWLEPGEVEILVSSLSEEDEEDYGDEPRSTNPDNPSPSGDPWWDDPRNVANVDAGLADLRAGRVTLMEDSEVYRQMKALIAADDSRIIAKQRKRTLQLT